tara:strand:+ start:2150 stop:2437 length:288 start_codon:yes stop_codon:yes gene_type:complete
LTGVARKSALRTLQAIVGVGFERWKSDRDSTLAICGLSRKWMRRCAFDVTKAALGPFFERQIACDERRAAFVTLRDQLEQQFSASSSTIIRSGTR